jgi:hypothetical protein
MAQSSTLITVLAISNIVFLFLYIHQSVFVARTSRALKTALDSQRALHLVVEEYHLAETMLKANKNNLQAMQDLVESCRTIGDRLAAYNENLNHLTSAVRTKIDRTGVKM